MSRVSLVFSRVSGTLQNYSVGNSLAPWVHLIAGPEQFPSGLGPQPSQTSPRKKCQTRPWIPPGDFIKLSPLLMNTDIGQINKRNISQWPKAGFQIQSVFAVCLCHCEGSRASM